MNVVKKYKIRLYGWSKCLDKKKIVINDVTKMTLSRSRE